MKSPCQRGSEFRAFTLIEILVVVAIIGILAAIAFSVMGGVRTTAAGASALSNTKQLFMANLSYSRDNNGELLSWGGFDNWNDDVFLMRNLNLYLTGENIPGTGAVATDTIARGLQPFVDPMVPEKFNKYSNRFPYTWSINSIFNRRTGRSAQGVAPWPGPSAVVNPRRLIEFEKPASTLFAVSGGYQFNSAFASNPSLLQEPVGRQAIFYYYGGGKSTPGVFLDGHAEMLTFPIDPGKIIPESR